MAKKPGPGKCVHCLRYFDKRNWDHVLPRSWYPDATPPNMHKWQIPTCKECNSEYGRIEEDLMVLLSFAVEPRTPASSGIYERAMRSIDESKGRGKRDRLARRARKERIMEYLTFGHDIPEQGIYPYLGERWGRPKSEQVAVRLPAKHIERLCEKIVRGIHYLEHQELIEPPFEIQFFALDDEGAKPIRDLLEQHGKRYTRGPGFEVIRIVPVDEPKASMQEIRIFGEFVMFAVVEPNEG